MVFGTFDNIHPGHVHLLKEAKEYGDYLIVVIGRDLTVCHLKGRSTINNENKRLKDVQQLNIADKVILGCLDDKYQAIKEEKPDVVALGYDQSAFLEGLENAIDEHAKIVRLSPYMPEIYKSSKFRID